MNFPLPFVPRTLEQFTADIEYEFLQGSAIDPGLYKVTTRIVSDTAVLPGGDVEYPIHEALNWKVTRFGFQARETLHAVFFQNENGSTWQAKLSRPKFDKKKKKLRKYDSPVEGGSQAYLPAVDVATWLKVAQKNHLMGFLPVWVRDAIALGETGLSSHVHQKLTAAERQNCMTRLSQIFSQPQTSEREADWLAHEFAIETSSFWEWVELLPISIVLTEGGKKALALLSRGDVAIALYGVNGGYTKVMGLRELIPGIQQFCQRPRQFVCAFDQDESDSTRRKVNAATHRFGGLLVQAGCEVMIAQWRSKQGKGVDDLIAQSGAAAWDTAYTQALLLEHWQILQHLKRTLTICAAIRVSTTDLDTLDPTTLPDQGLIAIASGKGTGKTKLVHRIVKASDKALAIVHRIALARNLSVRLGLDYRGDLDKAKGKFINGSGYTLRVGSCIDSLLAIDPKTFAGCDLIIDEVVQVIRHLLMSSTCAKDGRRPALLARLHQLIQVARRVIVADADLDNATVHYLQQLRNDGQLPFLIHNTQSLPGYDTLMLHASDRSVIIGQVLERVRQQQPGKVLYLSTDSKGTSKQIARLIAKQFPEKRVLVINSDTSGGECEREFTQTPDSVLLREEYDIIICSPSVATGVSIEIQGKIEAVYGIFTGASSTDADMTQALGRVREPVERIVWCAERGSNFSKVSRATSPKELKEQLRQQTTTTISLIRSGLRADIVGKLEEYDWKQDDHLNLYCQMAAAQNRAMYHLRAALTVRLRYEGNRVTEETCESNPALKLLLATARREQQEIDAEDLVAALDLTYAEVQALQQKEGLTPAESKGVSKFHFQEFYGLETLTLEDVLWDNEGRRRGELLNLESLLDAEVAIDQATRALEKQATWNQGHCPWDIPGAALRRQLWLRVGLDELIHQILAGWVWCKYDLKPYADRARAISVHIKTVLHFTIRAEMSDTQVVHQLLSQVGIKLVGHWSRAVEGHEGEKLRTYTLDRDHWGRVEAVLERRQTKRQHLAQRSSHDSGSPLGLNNPNQEGDPEPSPQNWWSPESLEEVREWISEAGSDRDRRAEVKARVPESVLRHLGVLL